MGVLILIGKGDWLISGYNTATPEERAQYNTKRLRLVMGVTTILIAGLLVVNVFYDKEWLVFATIFPIAILALILCNTWAKN